MRIDAGSAILRREAQIVDDHVRNAAEREMAGHKILCVNATTLFSEVAGELAKDRPFGACYFDRADGKRQWSLRSRNGGVDVSEIAKAHGGGGHRNAAGFEEKT
jgi:nanoRNase/pAp phosphatase (c-di-AMP/oligoRNAs hydrolase)